MVEVATNMSNLLSEPLNSELKLNRGARFYRCALQVNPFDYLKRHNRPTSFNSETEYNDAIVSMCLETEIQVVAVTDHYRVEHSMSLVRAIRDADLYAFLGFEAVTKDGVHFLCFFDPEEDDNVDRYIGECGVPNTNELSPVGKFDAIEFLDKAKEWGAACVAAHAMFKGGLLKTLLGQPRINVWTSPNLHACAIPSTVDHAPEEFKPILKNKNIQYKRSHPIAVLNASDVVNPEDLKEDKSSCFIKMSHVSIEAFRQAFLDPDSRVRLLSDAQPSPHTEFRAIKWEGGFLGDTAVYFNANLNVLIGGRGTGKSTVIESIRYVLGLDPLGDEAQKAYQGIVRYVLRSGTKISLYVRLHYPSTRDYVIERTVPNPSVVKDKTGDILSLSPGDVVPDVEVFGQHEISELTRSPEKLTMLLSRYIDQSSSSAYKAKLQLELEKSRKRIVEIQRELEILDEQLSDLVGLEETEDQFRQAGLEEQLKEKSLLVREEKLFSIVKERLQPFWDLHQQIVEEIPIDTEFLSRKATDGLPNADCMNELEQMVSSLNDQLRVLADDFAVALSNTNEAILLIKSRWDIQRKVIDEQYEKLLRGLQRSKIDGAEFIRIRQRIEELRPLRKRTESLAHDLETHEAQRRNLVDEWEDFKAGQYRDIEEAAKNVSKTLRNRVRVKVKKAGNCRPLTDLLRKVGGNISSAIKKLEQSDEISLVEFVKCCKEGKDSLVSSFGLTIGSAERIAAAGPELFMRIEELELTTTTMIELNVAAEDAPLWKSLKSLSTGQKATAVLLLLLRDSDAPLIIDQPEDDLDNRFITEGIVPIIRKEKWRRQLVFSTHNANVPVLGDAEQILGLTASGEAVDGSASISHEHMGSIDSHSVRELIENTLEGGKEAFEIRRSKYGF